MIEKLQTIMLVDDDPALNWISGKIIEIGGFAENVIDFINPKEALDYLKNKNINKEELPNVLFLDINMPYINGWDFLQELRVVCPHFSKDSLIYILTSSDFNEDVERAKNFPELSGYFVKPLSPDYFREVLLSMNSLIVSKQ